MLDDILDFYNAYAKDTEVYSSTKELFDYKYIQQEEISDIDFAERLLYKPNSETFFIPGKMYTFFYKREKMKKGVDNFPVILVTNVKTGNPLLGMYIEGINFNKIPAEYRAQVLDKYLTKFEPELIKMWDSAEKGETYVSSKIISALQDPNVLNDMFDKMIGPSYSTYYLRNIERPCLFEMDDWKFIPFYVDEGLDFGAMLDKFKKLAGKKASDAIKVTMKKFREAAKKKVKQLLKK